MLNIKCAKTHCVLYQQIKREKAIKRKEALELAKKEEEDTRLAEVFD